MESNTSPPALPEPISASSERTWAMLAHLSILLNLFTGFLGAVVALVIYLAYKDRSRYIAYQSFQAFLFQLVFFIGVGVLATLIWLVTIALMLVVVGCCLAPFAFLVGLIPFVAAVYGVIGAIQTSQGDDFRYWLVGDWTRHTVESPGPV